MNRWWCPLLIDHWQLFFVGISPHSSIFQFAFSFFCLLGGILLLIECELQLFFSLLWSINHSKLTHKINLCLTINKYLGYSSTSGSPFISLFFCLILILIRYSTFLSIIHCRQNMNDYYCFQTIQIHFILIQRNFFVRLSMMNSIFRRFQFILTKIKELCVTAKKRRVKDQRTTAKKCVCSTVCVSRGKTKGGWDKPRSIETNTTNQRKNTQLQCKLPKYWTRKQFHSI